MGKHSTRPNPLCSMRLAMLSLTALVTAGITTQHGPAPSNQATTLTATWSQLDIPDQTSIPAPTPTEMPRRAADPVGDADTATAPAPPSRPGLPLLSEPRPEPHDEPATTERPAPRPHHRPAPAAHVDVRTPSAATDLGSLLTSLGAALTAGATVARVVESGSAATEPPPAEETATADCAEADATAENPRSATDLGALLADLGTAVQAGAALTKVLESGSATLDTGSSLAETGSSALGPLGSPLEPGSAALGPLGSLLTSGSAALGPIAPLLGTGSATLAPLSAAAAASA
ncbi:hypothetical protein NDR87_21030 [Nocardia sp. CDC159]|uniref:Uncharacterized protein n=1 Tax=Nocardia pulmonis TaxID=2951408 RepID=A0A9X2EE35_9NOCA|nr:MULTISPECIES: hypothetical protein [Nocardia]MCM6776431.1 hypothetical protein [Nocardia pulmonis]MCM6788855.1 hypothetical protein [Nocardia sp. CDC159]